jgi:hypothetical protein
MRPEVIEGDVREVLKTLDDESVQCVVTSPPYWGLRDYGTATWEGGDKDCEHTINDGTYDPKKGMVVERPDRSSDKSCCIRCGAKRIDAQLGLESTPEEYVENMVDVFREVKRVLRKDGTVWLNLGDSYAGSNGSRGITETTPSVKKGDKVLLKRIEGRNFTEHKDGGMPILSGDIIGIPPSLCSVKLRPSILFNNTLSPFFTLGVVSVIPLLPLLPAYESPRFNQTVPSFLKTRLTSLKTSTIFSTYSSGVDSNPNCASILFAPHLMQHDLSELLSGLSTTIPFFGS